ncbi:MFS transporter [Streptomyces iconiensis]|uniref:MFS transporter n=1 Tax=Streptomyces iconiensis TaxID=1384038 RepID=A0ABT6ZPD7_9ACTN|nr:MFS transporter [Streptomyces iconiensis]MDJ1130924.1 MFS transporter [Streptomyces iconiensis]
MTRWGTTWTLLAFMLVNFADKTVMGLAANPIMEELGLTRSEFGTASSAFFALFSLAALGGSLLTRRVRTPVLLLGMALLWSAAQLPMVLGAAGFGTLLVTRVLLGAAEGPAAPVATHHLHGWFPRAERTLPTSILLFGAAAGVAIAAPTLGFVIDQWGWRAAFGTVGCIGLIWAALWLRTGREGPYAPPLAHRTGGARTPEGGSGEQSGAGADGAATAPVTAPAPVPYRQLLLSGTWLAAACGAFAAYWTLSAGLTWSADYLEAVGGLSLRGASTLIMTAALAKGLAMLAHGLLSQRAAKRAASGAGRRRPAWSEGVNNGLVLAVAALATAGFALTDLMWLKVVLLLGPMALTDIVLTVASTAVSRITPASQRGVTLGALTGVFALAGVLAPLTMGHVVDASASTAAGYENAYLLMASLVAVSGVVVALFLRPGRDADSAAPGERSPHGAGASTSRPAPAPPP